MQLLTDVLTGLFKGSSSDSATSVLVQATDGNLYGTTVSYGARTSNVTFNGTPAMFAVTSDTEIKTSVPDGATTGLIQVTTPSGPLSSNTVFRVRP